jgi:hypothetical protein
MHTAEPLLPGLSLLEAYTATEKLKRNDVPVLIKL